MQNIINESKLAHAVFTILSTKSSRIYKDYGLMLLKDTVFRSQFIRDVVGATDRRSDLLLVLWSVVIDG